MGLLFKIFVDEDVIYYGGLTEVPEKFRKVIIDDISEWADSLGKRGLNELLYSHLTWYEKKGLYCKNCNSWYEDGMNCTQCNGKLKELYFYDRNDNIDMLLTCIGMITRIEVIG